MSSKWDFLLESKPKELQQHLLDEVAKLLAKDLEAFPPPVQEWADSTEGQRLQALFANELSRPTPALYRMAFQLARWELQREHEAMAEFIRNERYREEAPEAHAKQVLLFHHEQSRTDDALDRIAQTLFPGKPARFVREGDEITL